MAKLGRLDTIELGTVHLIIGMARSGKQLLVSTGCFKDLTLEQSEGALVDIGVSVWQSDITCTDCLARRVEKLMADTDPVPTEFGVVRPGDTLMIRYDTKHMLTQKDVADLSEQWRDKMPEGVEVIVFMADGMVAVRPGDEIPDTRPHGRACGMAQHDHGLACSSNCPTCGGKAES